MAVPSVLVVIINWRQPELTIECVQALKPMLPSSASVLLIDNGSGDSSEKQLQEAFPDVELLALPENIGFSGAANRGLEQAIGQGFAYALLLNNDAFPAPDMLERLFAETAVDIALLSPKILYETKPGFIWFAGGQRHPQLLEMRQTGQGQPDGVAWAQTKDVDYLLGTSLLVNLAAVQQVGFLDEHYFMYYEDLDWSIRMQQAGYRLRLVADARLYHRVSFSTGGTDSPLHRYHLARSSLYFFGRHAHLGNAWMIFGYRLGSAMKMVVRLMLKGNVPTAWAYLRGLRAGWQDVRSANVGRQ